MKEQEEKQGYKDIDVKMCSSCSHFKSDRFVDRFGVVVLEDNLRCALGGFTVKKTGVCNEHKEKG